MSCSRREAYRSPAAQSDGLNLPVTPVSASLSTSVNPLSTSADPAGGAIVHRSRIAAAR